MVKGVKFLSLLLNASCSDVSLQSLYFSRFLPMIKVHEIKWIQNRRLQNSPHFCVFKYARAVKQKVWNEAENRERDWGETLKNTVFSLSPHTPYGRVRLARFARIRLLRHALPISLLILRGKPSVLQSNKTVENCPEKARFNSAIFFCTSLQVSN